MKRYENVWWNTSKIEKEDFEYLSKAIMYMGKLITDHQDDMSEEELQIMDNAWEGLSEIMNSIDQRGER